MIDVRGQSMAVKSASSLKLDLKHIFNVYNARVDFIYFQIVLVQLVRLIQIPYHFACQIANQLDINMLMMQCQENAKIVEIIVDHAILITAVKIANHRIRARDGCVKKEAEQSFDNCIQATSQGAAECQECDDGYYLNNYNFCSKCNVKNCFTCDSNNREYCTQCQETFILENGEYSSTGNCVSQCPKGFYGKKDFSQRGKIEHSYCVECHSECLECVNEYPGGCTRCKAGFYLSKTINTVSYGNCIAKTQQTLIVDLYVKPPVTINFDAASQTGEIGNPFMDIQDAIIRMPTTIDAHSQNIKLTITPLYCSGNVNCYEDETEKVTIKNKIRDRLNIPVGQGLTMKNIIINSLDSMIETNSYGGHITIQNSKFERFSTCGAIFRNFRKFYEVDKTLSQHISYNHQIRQNGYQKEIYDKFFEEDKAFVGICQTDCQSLTISNCVFTQFGIDIVSNLDINPAAQIENPTLINPYYGMHRQGKILHLDNFNGPTNITGNMFEYNILGYKSGCSILENENSFQYDQYNDPDVIFNQVYPPNDQYNSGFVQLKHLISIQNQLGSVQIRLNTFQGNSVIKGVINIDGTKDAGKIDLQDEYLPCGGILINANNFSNNFGCPLYGGSLIQMVCQTIESLEQLDQSKPLEISPQQFTYDQIIDLQEIVTQDFGSTNKNQFTLSNNNYIKNYAAYNEGMIDIRGMLWVQFKNENFTENGENVQESTITLQKFKTSDNKIAFLYKNQTEITDQKMSISKFFSESWDPSEYIKPDKQLLGLIYIEQSLYLFISQTTIKDNFIYEQKLNTEKGAFITIKNFYGFIHLSNVDVSKYKGMLNSIYATTDLKLSANSDISSSSMFAQTNPIIGSDQSSQLQGIIIIDSAFHDMKFQIDKQVYRDSPNVGLIYSSNGNTMSDFMMQNVTLNNIECWTNYNHSLFSIATKNASIKALQVSSINTQLKNQDPEFDLQQDDDGPQIFQLQLIDNIGDQTIVQDSFFENIYGNRGSVFNISMSPNQNGEIKTIFNNSFNNIVSRAGGIIHIAKGYSGKLEILNCNFTNTESYTKGGVLSSNPSWNSPAENEEGLSSLTFQYCNFESNFAVNDLYSDFYYQPISKIYSKRSGYVTFINQNNNIEVFILNNTFTQILKSQVNDTYWLYVTKYNENALRDISQKSYGTAIVIVTKDRIQINSQSNIYEGCRYGFKGGIYYVSTNTAYFSDIDSTYINSFGFFGGVIYCEGCQSITFENTTYDNQQAQQGGIIYSIKKNDITFDSPIDIQIISSRADNILSLDSGGFAYIYGNNTQVNVLIQHSNFTNVKSSQNQDEEFPIGTLFQSYYYGGGVIFVWGPKIIIDLESNKFISTSTVESGGVIYAISTNELNLSIMDQIIEDTFAKVTGAIIYAQSQLKTLNATLSDNVISCQNEVNPDEIKAFLADQK
ncbi:UNKNOWN [Stylonychia lemnae]|uniref:Uncharacterized protein n=1 Tax=Stylonychia lemnae TaxID=5949 RepID=A0A078A5N9_STYLE|nr:UNKNOWN [Stylonychia lemnae]|eukprot:CDW77226.1 UNKNOWN [Stylonychia lemnae]